jgi:release factor glutamine methyltransferase
MGAAMRIWTVPGVFRPISDSLMLAGAVRRWARPGLRTLDLFTGSGVIAVSAAQAGADAWAVDVSRRAVGCARVNGFINGSPITALRGDMFEPVEGARFDLISANPPYVPGVDPSEARGGARAWEGGPDGRELLDRFLAEAPRHLAPGGRLAVVHSSICGIEETVARLGDAGLQARVAEEREGELGPLMSERADRLERQGMLEPGARNERVAIIEAVADAARPRPERSPTAGAQTAATA